MKLLGWMHRKLRQNSTEQLKDFAIGTPSVDERQYHPKSRYSTKPLGRIQRDNYGRKSFASQVAAQVEEEEENVEEESTARIFDLFDAFLTIGTLGSDTVITDPSTPTLTISVENITQTETELTENELKIINEELEKVLGAKGKEDGSENNGNGPGICPLQGYLFGSTMELPETTVAKTEFRTSLEELFQSSKTAEEFSGAKWKSGEKRTEKETNMSKHLKKMAMMRRMLSSRSSNISNAGNMDSASTETKLHKLLLRFHKKVYPAISTSSKKSDKPHKREIRNNFTIEVGYNDRDKILSDEDIIIIPHRAPSREIIQWSESQSKPPQVTFSRSDSNGNKECWVKIDSDYLVLEL